VYLHILADIDVAGALVCENDTFFINLFLYNLCYGFTRVVILYLHLKVAARLVFFACFHIFECYWFGHYSHIILPLVTVASLEFRMDSAENFRLKKAFIQFHHVVQLIKAMRLPTESLIRFITDKKVLYLVCPICRFILQADIPSFIDYINNMIKNHLHMERFEFSITVPLRSVVLKEQELHWNCHLPVSQSCFLLPQCLQVTPSLNLISSKYALQVNSFSNFSINSNMFIAENFVPQNKSSTMPKQVIQVK